MTGYSKLVKALRYCVSGVCKNCSYFDKCKENGTAMAQLHNDAAAAIEALQAEVKRLEPKQRKLGRWEKAKQKGVVTYSDGYAECSSCHEVIWLGWGMNFCPHCGVQNRIIDPDDMAKMEAQE